MKNQSVLRTNKGYSTVAVLLLAGILLSVLAWDARAQMSEDELIPVTFGATPATIQMYIPTIMQQKGIAEKYGFDVQIKELAFPQQHWNGLRSGDIDVGVGNTLDLMRNRKGGLEARAITSLLKLHNPIVAAPDSGYDELTDLEGARVGTVSTSLMDWMVIRVAGEMAYGFDIQEDAEPVNASPPLIKELLQTGELDAAFQFNDLAIGPVHRGELVEVTTIDELLDEAGLSREILYLSYNLRKGWREEHPGAAEDLVAGMIETWELIRNSKEIWPQLVEISQIDPEITELYRKTQLEVYEHRLTRDRLPATQELVDQLIEVAGQEPVGFTEVDPEAYDFETYQQARQRVLGN